MADELVQPAARPKANKATRQLIGSKQRIEINEQRARESAGTPDNVISRKGFVAGAFALIIWAYYVFVARLCAPMLQKKQDAKGSVGEGVGLLIAFNILWLMFVWTYIKISFTSPGWAAKLVPKASAPEESMFTTTNTGTPYEYIGTTPEGNARAPPEMATTLATNSTTEPDSASTLTPAQEYASAHRRSLTSITSTDENRRTSRRIAENEDLDIDPSDLDGPRNMLPAEIALFTKSRSPSHPPATESTPPLVQGPSSPTIARQESMRDPSPSADPEHSGIQPSESSNSRSTVGASGGYRVSDVSNIETCDSHTPLQPIAEAPTNSQARMKVVPGNTGSSIPLERSASGTGLKHAGADSERMQAAYQNPAAQPQQPEWLHERPLPPHYPGLFFIIFCGWSTLFTLYITVVFATKLRISNLDGQMLALVIVGGFFSVFTITMVLSHIAMACSAMTTIESYSIRDQRDRESHLLAQKYGFFKCRTKTRTLRRWNYEYGDLKTEGNRWYIGGPMREWKLLMGDDPLGWILPIGQAKANGIHWEQNPRFGPNGERRKRDEWPENLR
ncbi:hypothetical protein QFC21_003626 [Naganishia friedmannii]|uniref:Uncharacterized protein n=1 Tax=Naganishia friedmannii TaxID=89922 RepID=A0ACC2VMR2_9TREE|nr:hypothetical protein QFC21_003626 [Naganishia friedmannii]